ncbi:MULTISPECIES: hypothetical protein [Arsenophonus]|jgi:hypothetical protein|uniref:hypothetical protein n=1 Tax=Arsenophonus TaxID=637 RepID=UPI0015D7EF02|nr:MULTISPECIES: hypothetical protein [Arsenophonus]UBX29553.1 hypothetical protein LDL57_02355 [Arsenophonus apicola]
MKSTIKILIITTLLSSNFFALAGDKTPSSSTVKDKDAIYFKGNDKAVGDDNAVDDDYAVEKNCNPPTHEYSGEGCIDIR